MQEDPKHPGAGGRDGRGAELRARLAKFRGQHQRSFLGVPEIIALSAAGLLLFAALASYFLLLRPQRTRLNTLREEQARLERGLREAKTGVEQFTSTQASVEAILRSLEEFETRHLGQNTQGSTALIEELNRLIRRHNLRISGGLAFTAFEVVQEADPQRQRQQQTASASKPIQDVFPGTGISISVEGTYPSLRRFIRDVEADPQFIVINSIELEGVTDSASRMPGASPEVAPDGTAIVAPAPTTARGTLVSLRLDMAAYFRRPGASYEQPADGEAPSPSR
ncbi:MAG TPA: hypothetical protein VFX96_02835 [Pyrinomonadaceae bacterium]|nr:hypothetical protein [Pyrinomonadaceae bacterium]